MMNSKTTNQPRKGDKMTTSQHVSVENFEHSNPVFEHSKCSDSFDPLITAYDYRWNKLFVKPLSQIEGMAYGVREDLLTGKYMPGAIIGNQCPAISSTRVCFWVFVD